jgi:hypothetical protein
MLAIRFYPKARTEERWGEVVTEARSLPDRIVSNPVRWLKARLSALEVEEIEGGEKNKDGGSAGGVSGSAGSEVWVEPAEERKAREERERRKRGEGEGEGRLQTTDHGLQTTNGRRGMGE